MQSDNCHFMPDYTRIGNLLGPIREVSYYELLKFDDFELLNLTYKTVLVCNFYDLFEDNASISLYIYI